MWERRKRWLEEPAVAPSSSSLWLMLIYERMKPSSSDAAQLIASLTDLPDWVSWGITSRRGGKLYTVYLGGSTSSQALKSRKLANGGRSKPELALTSFSWFSRVAR